MDDLARRQVSGYFARFPQWTVGVLAVGFIIIFAAEGPLGYVVGIGALLASGAMGALWFKSRPGDAQMDLWFREDLTELQARALTKANLDQSQLVRDNVVVIGVKFQNLGGAALGFRRGGDGRARFTPVDTTIINFTEHQLVIYQCMLDLTTGKPLNEGVDEYFYNDVVSVATRSEAHTYELSALDTEVALQASQAQGVGGERKGSGQWSGDVHPGDLGEFVRACHPERPRRDSRVGWRRAATWNLPSKRYLQYVRCYGTRKREPCRYAVLGFNIVAGYLSARLCAEPHAAASMARALARRPVLLSDPPHLGPAGGDLPEQGRGGSLALPSPPSNHEGSMPRRRNGGNDPNSRPEG